MHPELAKAVRAAKIGKMVEINGSGPPDWEVREENYLNTINQLNIKLDAMEASVLTLKKELVLAKKELVAAYSEQRWPRLRQPPLALIMEATATHFGMAPRDAMTQRRLAKDVLVRQIMFYLAFNLTAASDQEIANFIDRDRASVFHGRKKIERELETNPKLKEMVGAISLKLVGLQLTSGKAPEPLQEPDFPV